MFADAYANYSTTAPASAGGSPLLLLFDIAVIVLIIASMWRIFTKAGRPGWAAIVPIYNAYVLLKMVGRPGWWLLLYFIPFVNIAIVIVVALDLAKAFGKSSVFGVVGLFLFSFVGYPMLAFGDAKYLGPDGGATPPAGPAAAAPPAAPAA